MRSKPYKPFIVLSCLAVLFSFFCACLFFLFFSVLLFLLCFALFIYVVFDPNVFVDPSPAKACLHVPRILQDLEPAFFHILPTSLQDLTPCAEDRLAQCLKV